MYDLQFNVHDILLIMTAALSMLLAAPMLVRRNRQQDDVLLACFILVQGGVALYYLLLYSVIFRPYTVALTVPFQVLPIAFLFAIQGLLLLWYSKLMAGQTARARKSEIIPFIILLLIPIIIRAASGQVEDEGLNRDGIFLTLPTLIASFYYGMRAITAVLQHERQIRDRYSNIENVNLVWLGYIALGFVGVWCLRLVGYFFGMFEYFDWAETLSVGANIPPLFLIASMVILGLSQDRVSTPKSSSSTERAVEQKPDPKLIERLENLMTNIKVYQDPDLDREGLADSLGVSPRSLSTLINGHYQMNFYEFVNEHRVAAAKEALVDLGKKDLSIQRVFEESGFNSKSTFNTLFKKSTGKTPTEFRQQHMRTAAPA